MTKIIQEPPTLKQAAPGSDLLDALEKHFRDASTAGIMLHQTVANRLGLNTTDHKCMGMLCEFGSLSAGKMAELTGLTTGAITGVLNRLERHGYARRVRNPEDKRNISVEAINVAEFGKHMEELLGSLGERMRALSSTYSVEELTLIDGFVQRAIAITCDETRRLRTKQPPGQPSSTAPGTPARRGFQRASDRGSRSSGPTA